MQLAGAHVCVIWQTTIMLACWPCGISSDKRRPNAAPRPLSLATTLQGTLSKGPPSPVVVLQQAAVPPHWHIGGGRTAPYRTRASLSLCRSRIPQQQHLANRVRVVRHRAIATSVMQT
nr:hypothetical protein CFP56_50931 [Quercus suber]